MVPPDASTLATAVAGNSSLSTTFGRSAFHLGSHPQYTGRVQQELLRIRGLFNSGTITRAQAIADVDALILRARTAISTANTPPVTGTLRTVNDVVF